MRTLYLAAAIAALAPLPARAAPSVQLQGRGAQVYTCGPAQNGFAWRFVAPDADLFDSAGNKVGHHFAGPSWHADDGSLVVGEVVTSSAASKPGAIPWLLLRAKSHTGDGMFQSVTFVIRADTVGGVAPTAPCDAAHSGTEQRVPYTATYIFLSGD